MATALPSIDDKKKKETRPTQPSAPPPPPLPTQKSIVMLRREIREHIDQTLEEARIPGSFKFTQMMYKLKEGEADKRRRNLEAAHGVSFLAENRLSAARRHQPHVKLGLLVRQGERNRGRAIEVVARRNAKLASLSLGAVAETGLHRECAAKRDAALRRWVLDQAAHNANSLQRRWLVIGLLAAKTEAVGFRLNRKRTARKWLKTFLKIALASAKVQAWALRRRKRVGADRAAHFLREMKSAARMNKWVIAFERAKRCVVRCQRRWRDKLRCRAAHRRALLVQLKASSRAALRTYARETHARDHTREGG
eukprot:CAMPEP_0172615816 /NCGR_PEP_ID=MMETSP1068-20121228/62523_1 /TAXON_ID=35684 /ORGANISM="Pseudopedinella elastica, Strain CCMP716" /LENGTH=308 /DNA_ID=CAMNT_0013421077 /DNA_START=70 /DNA_END=993 /DNA_ORIENTATION=-